MTITTATLCLAAVLVQDVLAASPAGSVAVPLQRDPILQNYLAPFSVGTPRQNVYLKIDTGSPTISFFDPQSNLCQQANKPCAKYGTFDNTSSSTSEYAGPGFNDGLIDYGSGILLNDTVQVGGVSTPELEFGYLTSFGDPDRKAPPAASIVGLNLDCFSGPNCDGPGPYLLPQLKNRSVISRSSVSVYLGPDNPDVTNAEMILGGAYDKAKLAGPLFTMNMVDPRDNALTNDGTNFLNVTSISAVYGKKSVKVTNTPKSGEPYLLDTGNPYWRLPDKVYDLVSSAFGGLNAMTSNYTYIVDCKHHKAKNNKGTITVHFGSAGKINVPFNALVTSFGNGTCTTAIGRGDSGNLGDPFLRNVYAIFDQEAFTMSLAQVKHTTKRNIVSIPEGGFKPGAPTYG